MSIRNASKAIILHGNKILLVRFQYPDAGECYDLPGGGQNPFETIQQALVRECLEETGFTVVPERFVALGEVIHTHESVKEPFPEHAHRIYHIFRCRLADTETQDPTERDTYQSGCVWVDLDDIPSLNLQPHIIRDNIRTLLQTETPVDLSVFFDPCAY